MFTEALLYPGQSVQLCAADHAAGAGSAQPLAGACRPSIRGDRTVAPAPILRLPGYASAPGAQYARTGARATARGTYHCEWSGQLSLDTSREHKYPLNYRP